MNTQQTAFGHMTLTTRVVLASVAFVASATMLGGTVGLFEMPSNEAAFAKASAPVQVTSAATTRGARS
jgi:hypothetical protein